MTICPFLLNPGLTWLWILPDFVAGIVPCCLIS